LKLEELVESLSRVANNIEDLLVAIEEAGHLGMNHLYIAVRRGSARAVLAMHINPYTGELLSLVAMIPLGCGDQMPSIEDANRAAKSLGGAVMVVGGCAYVLSGYDGSTDPGDFISGVLSRVPGDAPGERISVEDYSYDIIDIDIQSSPDF